MTTATQTTDKTAGLPPPLPAAAKGAAKPLSEAGHALFGGMKEHMATKGAPGVMSGLLKGASLEVLKSAFLDELEQISLEKDAAEAERKKPPVSQQLAAAALGGPGGYFGLMKGAPHGAAGMGAIRGILGTSLGGGLGGGLGAGLGHLAGHALGGEEGAAIGGLAGNVLGAGLGGYTGYKALTRKYDEPAKTAADLTEEARSHIAKKNFAVSAKASNTGKPAYPIEDKAHAKAALGLAAMHGDKKDLAEVRKDVGKKFPGMEKKEAAMSPDEQQLEAAWQQHRAGMTGGQKLREILSALGGAGVGAGLGAGAGNLGARGLNAVAGRQLMRPSTGTMLGGMTGLGLGGGLGSIIGDVHGESDVRAGKSLENYANLEDRVLGSGHSAVRSAQKVQGGKKEAGVSFAAFSDAFMATLGFDRTKTAGVLSNLGKA